MSKAKPTLGNEERTRAADAAGADQFQLARHALSTRDNPYDWTPTHKTDAVYKEIYQRESRHRGIVGICAHPTMIDKCCQSDLGLQRLPHIKELCKTRAQARE